MELLCLCRDQKSPQREILNSSLSTFRNPTFYLVYTLSYFHPPCCRDSYLSVKFKAHLRLSGLRHTDLPSSRPQLTMVENSHWVTRALFDIVLLGQILHACSQLEVDPKHAL